MYLRANSRLWEDKTISCFSIKKAQKTARKTQEATVSEISALYKKTSFTLLQKR